MRYHYYFYSERHMLGLAIILIYTILLSIIAFMWIHIEQQDETIQYLRMKISNMECCIERNKEHYIEYYPEHHNRTRYITENEIQDRARYIFELFNWTDHVNR